MEIQQIEHYPVLYREVLRYLPEPCQSVLDGTLGHGGHAKVILNAHPIERYVGLDRDPAVIRFFEQNPIGDCFTTLHCNFSDREKIEAFFEEQPCLDAILLDLGTSQFQLRNPERGFSFLTEGPLDMRMNTAKGMTLADFLKVASVEELSQIIREYGEDKFHFRIARRICEVAGSLESTLDLAREIENCLPKDYLRKQKIHGATRTFQALRIYLNRELDSLEEALGFLLDFLRDGGRLLIISFHSLEDRMVKQCFAKWESKKSSVPSELRAVLGDDPEPSRGVRITRKAIKPGDLEIRENPPSRSARLRVFERRDS